MMPLVETASRMPCPPPGEKPLAALKFEPWKWVTATTKMTASGTPTFHQVATLLVNANARTPRKLIDVNRAIKSTATMIPDGQ
jgi:hypothetical protein